MAVVAVGLPALGFLAAASLTPDFAEPLFRKFFTAYIAMVTALVLGAMAGWRLYIRRQGLPPIQFLPDALEVPRNSLSRRIMRVPYDQILSAAAMRTLRGEALVIDTRRSAFIFPRHIFATPASVEDFQQRLHARIVALPDGAARWARMESRAAIAQRFAAPRPWATWATLALIITIYLVQVGVASGLDPVGIVDFGANAAALVGSGQWFRLITANLLHVDALHIVSNVLLIWIFGTLVERQLGTQRFVIIALASGLASQIVSSLVAQFQLNGTPSVGISGVVFGLLGAQAVLDHRFRKQMPGFYRLAPAAWWIVVVLNFVILPLTDRAPDNAAHAGGLAAGVALGWMFSRGQRDIADHRSSTSGARIALGSLSGVWLLGVLSTGVHGASVEARAVDRMLLGRYALVHGTPNPVTDHALARAIAFAPGMDTPALEVALALADRAGGSRRRGRRNSSELVDTLAVIHYRLGHLETAIDLQMSIMRQGNAQFATHLARFLEAYNRANGIRHLGDANVQARAVTVTRLVDDVSVNVGPGDPLPQGARIYALVHRDGNLLGVLEVYVAPRDATGTDMPRRASGPLPPVMEALVSGAQINVVQFDSSGCVCFGDGAGYTEYREDADVPGIYSYISKP